ncbi:MAG: aldo/keto reductase, partial [Eubacterium sp.]
NSKNPIFKVSDMFVSLYIKQQYYPPRSEYKYHVCWCDTLQKRKEAGQIRHLGFSFHGTPDKLEELIQKYPWDFVQLQLNYIDWDVQNAKRQYEILEENKIQCIVMEPLRGGTLAVLCDDAKEILKKAEPEKSLASWALRYAATLPNVLTVLSGMSAMDQVVDNILLLTH